MDTRPTSDPNVLILTLQLAEAKDIAALVDHFRRWDLIATATEREPMMFMLRFGTDCRSAATGNGTLHYPIESGQVPLAILEVGTLARFLKACVDVDGPQMTWVMRRYLSMAWKTLDSRVVIAGGPAIERSGFFRRWTGR
jgi:hypothetical protein